MRVLALAAAVSSGLSAGAMLFIHVVLLPFWQGTPPADFRSWFAALSDRIRGLMVPLGTAAAVTAGTTALAETATGGDARKSSAVAAASAVGVGVITAAVNEPANREFVRQDLDDAETTRLLDRWGRWHNVRVALGLVGTLAATRTLVDKT